MDNLAFTAEETKTIYKSTRLYNVVKHLLIKAEQEDQKNKTNIQILLELRNALDHFERVLIKKFTQNEEEEDTHYNLGNLDKTYGHLYRAGFDLLDWLSITLKDRIEEKMAKFSMLTINTIFPDYYITVAPRIEHISRGISNIREKKDVESEQTDTIWNESLREDSFESFSQYIAQIDELEEFNEIINDIRPTLIAHHTKQKSDGRNDTIKVIVIALISAFFGYLFGLVP